MSSNASRVLPRTCARAAGEGGFSLAEVMVATALLATALVGLAQMFGLATRSNIGSRNTTYATVLADQKLEELRSLTWGFDTLGLPVTDVGTDTTDPDQPPTGGTGLQPSPPGSLGGNTPGYVDFIDQYGKKIAVNGGADTPADAVYTRRWSIEPLPINPNNTLIIQVLVTRSQNRGDADDGKVKRLPEEARVVTVKTRKAQ